MISRNSSSTVERMERSMCIIALEQESPALPSIIDTVLSQSSGLEEQEPLCHILTELTVIPRSSPSPHVGSHVPTSLQKVHCAFVASSSHGFPPLLSLVAFSVLANNTTPWLCRLVFPLQGRLQLGRILSTHANHPFLAPTATFRMR